MGKERNSDDAILRIVTSSATWAQARQRVLLAFGPEAVDLAGSVAVRVRGREWVRGAHDRIEVESTSDPTVNPSKMRKWFAAISGFGRVAVCLFLAFLAVHTVATLISGVEDRRRLDEQCRPDGWLAQLEASLLGQRFWRDQEKFLEAKRRDLRELPVQIERLEGEVRASTQASVEELLREHPELGPRLAPVQAQAAALRAAADALEKADGRAKLQSLFAEMDEALARCSIIAQQRSLPSRP